MKVKVELKPGKYIVAVSGGVDSVALLNILSGLPDVELVAAHFDHGIREDSHEDHKLVQALAERYRLPFVSAEGRLGPKASEAAAREARYDFLRKVQSGHKARAIVTAHHQDDLLETAIINLLRGTGRKGLTSLSSWPGLKRPLLDVPKRDLVMYAKGNGLRWREDSTNRDENHLRNYVRHNIVPRLDADSREKLLGIVKTQAATNQKLDTLLVKQLAFGAPDGPINRQWFNSLPHEVARETMAAWLRANGIRSFDSKTIERLAAGAKTARRGSSLDILGHSAIRVSGRDLALMDKER